MNRIDRLFGILILLQSRKYTSADYISEKFQISIRTVYRDIKALGEQGVPVSFEQPKGYFIVQGYFLPPVSFNTDEANALLITERLVGGFADKSTLEHYTSALNKVKSVLRTPQKEKLEQLNDKIHFQLPECMKNEFSHLSVLQHAISTKCVIEIKYANQRGEETTRHAEPIGLIFYAFNWHLIGWCHLRFDYRDFRVSRITDVTCMDATFTKNDHIPLSDYMKKLPVNY